MDGSKVSWKTDVNLSECCLMPFIIIMWLITYYMLGNSFSENCGLLVKKVLPPVKAIAAISLTLKLSGSE